MNMCGVYFGLGNKSCIYQFNNLFKINLFHSWYNQKRICFLQRLGQLTAYYKMYVVSRYKCQQPLNLWTIAFKNTVIDLKQIGSYKQHTSSCKFHYLEILYTYCLIHICNLNEVGKKIPGYPRWLHTLFQCHLHINL